DNSLDNVEATTNPQGDPVAPRVKIVVKEDSWSVRDNGSGIPPETVRGSLDYSVRVSNKAYYVSPTRGALGNALKCLWAAPFVIDGQQGRAEVTAQGIRHAIAVRLDRLAGKPALEHAQDDAVVVRNGTFLKVHWNDVAKLPRLRMAQILQRPI